jgi:uncharacterized membrane protein (UPF0127 family)
MRRWAPFVAIVAVLVGCGSDGEQSGGTSTSVVTTSSTNSDATTTSTGPLAPPTTVDLDGREPDEVEPPPVDGVPVTAVPATGTTRTPLPGFGEVEVEVQRVDGEVVSWCLLLAETSAQTRRGLMEVTDPGLGGYDGMLFRFEAEHDGGFYMRNTPQPLSIVYLDEDGDVVSITRMEPCPDEPGCPTYPAEGPFRRTIEVPVEAGGVEGLGIVPGAVVADTGRTCDL